ncbi:DNA polymerase delta small subunit Cdc1 [Metarhizium acridum]|nr:DNA polymerase delta small subunit Cdc1 [Metarhizium acridum]
MVTLEEVSHLIPKTTSDAATPTPSRVADSYNPLHAFDLDKQRSYKQQYGDMYFLRLTKIKPAWRRWHRPHGRAPMIGGEEVKRVERVLDVRQGELCWVAGTVYMEMPLKPNILEDVSKDLTDNLSDGFPPPYPPSKTYFSHDGSDQIMLEDDSGRIRLVGDLVQSVPS